MERGKHLSAEGQARGRGSHSGWLGAETDCALDGLRVGMSTCLPRSSSFSISTLRKIQRVLRNKQNKTQPSSPLPPKNKQANSLHSSPPNPSIWAWLPHTAGERPSAQQMAATQPRQRNSRGPRDVQLQLFPGAMGALLKAGSCPIYVREDRHILPLLLTRNSSRSQETSPSRHHVLPRKVCFVQLPGRDRKHTSSKKKIK